MCKGDCRVLLGEPHFGRSALHGLDLRGLDLRSGIVPEQIKEDLSKGFLTLLKIIIILSALKLSKTQSSLDPHSYFFIP